MAGTDKKDRKLVMLTSTTGDNCCTFVFKGESHTLGNALRAVLLQNPNVLFCGYSMPHPAEDQMLLRIQTTKGVEAQDVLRKALQDLKSMCEITKQTFKSAVQDEN